MLDWREFFKLYREWNKISRTDISLVLRYSNKDEIGIVLNYY